MENIDAQEQKRRLKRLLIFGGIALAAAAALCVFLLISGKPEGEPFVDDRIHIKEGIYPQDTESVFTLMIYMVGSDLESTFGCASSDIKEMLGAELGENVQVVIQTGGCSGWFTVGIPSDSVQRFTIRDGELIREADIGLVSMLEQDTLSDFIQWTAQHHPAQRYGLVLWDHGGGTFMGFGRDENFPEKMMGISAIQQGIADGGEYFDFIGIDACLMATMETAYMLVPYADYLIASEETEPGWGWHYGEWISIIGNDPDVDVEVFAKHIVNDFVNGEDSIWGLTTLSVIDLSKIPALYERLCELTANTERLLEEGGYRDILAARKGTGFFGKGEYEQIDMTEYLNRLDIEGCGEVTEALNEALVCFDSSVDGANGLAMYFPCDYPDYYEGILAELRAIGLDEDYLRFFDKFVSLSVSGQVFPEYEPPMKRLTGAVSPEAEDFGGATWFDENAAWLAESTLGDLDGNVVLNSEQRRDIAYIELQVFLDDGEGYVDLGGDNIYDFDGDMLIREYDGRWVSLNGQTAAFRAKREVIYPDGSWYTYGYVPAILNGDIKIEIMLQWDNDSGGYVRGYRTKPAAGDDLSQKRLRNFERGDTIQLYANYYSYEGEFTECRYLGEPIEYDSLTVSYESIGGAEAEYCWRLRDIFGKDHWTEMQRR